MKISPELQLKKELKKELLFQKIRKLQQKGHKLGESCEPRPAGYVEDDPQIGHTDPEWAAAINPENAELDAVLKEILATAPPTDTAQLARLGADNLWVWGGPTPYWGGSMADDTLVKGAAYFNARNAVYVYGPTDDRMLSLHSGFDKMLCQVNEQCRTPGAQSGSNEENAAELGRLSLKYPNIKGAMLDDSVATYQSLVLPDNFEAVGRAMKAHNPDLKTYCVIYAHELGSKNFALVQPYIDVVNLWFWSKDEILKYDETIELCREKFPGKPILQGIFLHDYGCSDAGSVPELLAYQLDRARKYLTDGVVEGVVILGDREIKKWPTAAAAVKKYLENQ